MKNEHEVIFNGTPKLANMPKTEFEVFCKSLLDILIAEWQEKEADKPTTANSEKNKR